MTKLAPFQQPRSQGFFSRRRTRMKEREKESPGIVRLNSGSRDENVSIYETLSMRKTIIILFK